MSVRVKWPKGPCALCGDAEPAAHRVLDSILERIAAGEPPSSALDDYGYTADEVLELVRWVGEWRREHQGAW
jgi:hypothetical protein